MKIVNLVVTKFKIFNCSALSEQTLSLPLYLPFELLKYYYYQLFLEEKHVYEVSAYDCENQISIYSEALIFCFYYF